MDEDFFFTVVVDFFACGARFDSALDADTQPSDTTMAMAGKMMTAR